MKRFLATLTVALTAAVAGAAVPGVRAQVPAIAGATPLGDPLGLNYQQVFGDEFNGTAIDGTRWGLERGWTVNDVRLNPAACSESGGNLVLMSGCQVNSFPASVSPGSNSFRLTRGEYVEARMLQPADSSGACANWDAGFTTATGDWPNGGELDFSEVLNPAARGWGPGSSNVYVHSIGPGGLNQQGDPPPGPWCGDWHVFGVYRGGAGDNKAYFYFDGSLVATIPTNDDGIGQALSFVAGAGMGTSVNAPLYVDWVRAYQPVAAAPTATARPTAAPHASPSPRAAPTARRHPRSPRRPLQWWRIRWPWPWW